MSAGTAAKDDLHSLVDDLPDEKVETARRFLQSLRGAEDMTNFIAQFVDSMDGEERALLDGLAELDRDGGAAPPTPRDSDPPR